MTDYQAGMMVRQRAIEWWPYIGTIVNRLNEACEKRNPEVLTDIFLDAGKVVCKIRRDITVNAFRENLNEQLRYYRIVVRDAVRKNKRLQNPIGKHGKPLTENTLKQYRAIVKNWPLRREGLKEEIRNRIDEIKTFSNEHGKIISRGNVSLKLLYGGQHSAKLQVLNGANEWRQIR